MASSAQMEAQIQKLKEKYESMGQDINAYLDGLLCSNYLTYWDYIHLDTLLSLQNPRTDFPDEEIFIMYHQITELYFKLVLHEMHQIAGNGKIMADNGQDLGWNDQLDAAYFARRLARVNAYFEALTTSFGIMVDGMEKEQFLRFRMALLPASGFQSAQYRMIEICATRFIQLVDKDHRHRFAAGNHGIDQMYEHIYWKQGATEADTGKKTLTLKQFEQKYSERFKALATEFTEKNMWAKYRSLSEADQADNELIYQLKQLDVNVNINWPLVHYKSAVRYLARGNNEVAATGGTNWQQYLPPRFQKRIFYPELWSEEEMNNWGKSWVEKEILRAGSTL